jgi:hypothetical protein
MLLAARADVIPEGEAGLWHVKKFATRGALRKPTTGGREVWLPPGHYTQLWRCTMATMHLNGELVMQDTPEELNTHLEFMMRAHGRVLITGLGLGCALRGCLANPRVQFCLVIERDPAVIKLVMPYLPKGRFDIIIADALEWCKDSKSRFDCAWHDIWNDADKGEPHLALLHAQLFGSMKNRVQLQGAWNMPRHFRRLFQTANVI